METESEIKKVNARQVNFELEMARLKQTIMNLLRFARICIVYCDLETRVRDYRYWMKNLKSRLFLNTVYCTIQQMV